MAVCELLQTTKLKRRIFYLSKTINVFSKKYDNFLLMGDFNLATGNVHLHNY